VYLFGGMVHRGGTAHVDKAVYILESSKAEAPEPEEKSAGKDQDASASLASKVENALPKKKPPELTELEDQRPVLVTSCVKPTASEAATASGAETAATTADGTPRESPRVAIGSHKGSTRDTERLLGASEVLDVDDEDFDEPELSFEELLEQEKAFFKAQSEKASFPRAQEVRQEARRKENASGKKNQRIPPQ